MEKGISIEDFIIFIREEIGEFKMELNVESLIEDDLGVTGADAENLIQSYRKRFNVDTQNFQFAKYFYSEPGWLIFDRKRKFPLTVGDLYKGIKAKKLDDSIIQKH